MELTATEKNVLKNLSRTNVIGNSDTSYNSYIDKFQNMGLVKISNYNTYRLVQLTFEGMKLVNS